MKTNKRISLLTLLTLTGLITACGPSNVNTDSSTVPNSSVGQTTSSIPASSTGGEPSVNSSVIDSSVVDTTVHVTDINIDKDSVTLEEGETATISVEVLPENATDKSYTFTVGNPDVASITNDGEILGIKAGTTAITAHSTDGDLTDTMMVNVYHSYSIEVNAPTGVSVDVVSKAQEGDLVYVELSYDETALIIDRVLANSVELGTEEGRYYFYMPSEDVELVVAASPYVYYHQVISTQTSMVHLETAGAYPAGSQVEISFTVLPGYQFEGTVQVWRELDAFDPADRVQVEASVVDGVISFVMPNEDVEIVLGITASLFTITKDDDYSHIYGLKADDSNVYATNSDYIVKYGQTITVTFVAETNDANDVQKPTGVFIPEMQLTLAIESNTVTFVMPYYNVTLKVLTTPVYRNITLQASEHISLDAYLRVDDEYALITNNQAVYGDKVYLKATFADEENYQLRSLTGSYIEKGSSYTSSLQLTLESDGYYSFTMPRVDLSQSLIITVVEKDMTLFTDASFIGSYIGVELYSGRATVTSFDSSLNTVIDSSGIMVQGSSSTKEHVINSYDSTTNIINLTNWENTAGIAYFEDNLIATHYRFSGSTLVTSDMNFLIKKQNAADDDSLYSFYGVMIGHVFLGEVLRDGEVYQTFIADSDKQIVVSNVTFAFTEGEYVTDSNATYIVSSGDELYYYVENKTNLGIFDGLQDTYSNDDGETLIVDGLGTATYNDVTYSYTVKDDRTITMTRMLETYIEKIVVSLGVDEKTFVIESIGSEDFAPIYGHNFYGKTTYNYYIHIVFDRPGNCIVYVMYEFTASIPSGYNYGYDGDATYTYDSDTSTLVVTTSSYGEATFIISETDGSYVLTCDSSTIKFTGGLIATNAQLTEFELNA